MLQGLRYLAAPRLPRARAGQRLLLGCSGLSFRLEKIVDSGSAEPVTSWIRACDLELPESRDGIYHLRFREPAGHSDAKSPPLFLIEIR